MAKKPTYEELEQKVKELEQEISEHKWAVQDTRNSQHLLQMLIDTIEGEVFVKDVNGKYLLVNKAFGKDFGVDPNEVIGKDDFFVFSPEDAAKLQENDKRIMAAKKAENIEERGIIKGKNVIFLSNKVPLIADDGNVLGICGVGFDITEQKQAEEALRESEEKFRSFVENANDIVYSLSLDGIFSYVSPNWTEILGHDPSEVVGKHFEPFVHPDDFPVCLDFLKKVLATGEKQSGVEYRVKHKDGGWRWHTTNASPIRDSERQIASFVGIAHDITDGKQTKEALRKSEEKYRSVLENIEEGYYETDLAGNFTFFNASLCRIFGYSENQLMGMNYKKNIDKETGDKLYGVFNKVYKTGTPVKGFEHEVSWKDGSKSFVEISVSLLRDGGDKPMGFRGITRDITERKLAEKENKRLEAHLQYAQRMESIGTLAGGIAHNFNNLLMGIMGYASLILLETDPDHPNHKRLKNIEKQIKSGSKLTSQLLGYAREGSYEVRPISLNQLVKETSDTFGMTKKEITVHQELSENLYGIKADQGQIEQVLLNLYVNAADAMPGGGDLFLKTINIGDKDITGKPYKVKSGNYVLLTVRDTGVGMDKEAKNRVFEPFFTTKGLASGTGLGMASAYGIIKAHEGYIDVDSKKGQGTTFNIYLPATEKLIKEKKALSHEVVKGNGTVLLVDDEEMVLDAGQEMLEYLGYEVLLAGDGKKAVELYRKNQNKIDMVLLDMVMPVMGGGETFDRIKEINTNVKVLLSSGYSLEGEAKEILKRGCDAFIQKPYKPEDLSQKIGEILDKK